MSLEHVHLARCAVDAALRWVDGSSMALPDSSGRRLHALVASAAGLPTARPAAILPAFEDEPLLDLWVTIARLALLLAGEDICDGRLPDPWHGGDEIRARCSAATQQVLGDLGDSDFVLLTFWDQHPPGIPPSWSTSSARYSTEIATIINGNTDTHNACRRVRDVFGGRVHNQVCGR